ncbi:hypothetical protein BC832DRAFT_537083 [Gaertneriomyces semiglobifer]|nr:hypothetical protein BC832DRAFT_537083 [Gaertneriomyces semiglobifer]
MKNNEKEKEKKEADGMVVTKGFFVAVVLLIATCVSTLAAARPKDLQKRNRGRIGEAEFNVLPSFKNALGLAREEIAGRILVDEVTMERVGNNGRAVGMPKRHMLLLPNNPNLGSVDRIRMVIQAGIALMDRTMNEFENAVAAANHDYDNKVKRPGADIATAQKAKDHRIANAVVKARSLLDPISQGYKALASAGRLDQGHAYQIRVLETVQKEAAGKFYSNPNRPAQNKNPQITTKVNPDYKPHDGVRGGAGKEEIDMNADELKAQREREYDTLQMNLAVPEGITAVPKKQCDPRRPRVAVLLWLNIWLNHDIAVPAFRLVEPSEQVDHLGRGISKLFTSRRGMIGSSLQNCQVRRRFIIAVADDDRNSSLEMASNI